VKTGQDGQPIAGANVTVTFFMAAMPAMGMASMKTVINASDRAAGMYEGKGDLGSVALGRSPSGHNINGQRLPTSNSQSMPGEGM